MGQWPPAAGRERRGKRCKPQGQRGGKGPGEIKPPDFSGKQAPVEKQLWCAQTTLQCAEFMLSHVRNLSFEEEFAKLRDEMVEVAVLEGQEKKKESVQEDNEGGKGSKGHPVKEKPLEIQIRNVHANQQKHAKAKENL